jgi:hypothetical protein
MTGDVGFTSGSADGSASRGATSSAAAPTPESSASVGSLIERIRRLESQFDTQDRWSGVDSGLNESLEGSEAARPEQPFPVRGKHHKTRFFGQSHWMNGADLVSISRNSRSEAGGIWRGGRVFHLPHP